MVWLWFCLGQLLNVLRQAKLASRSSKNQAKTVWDWIHRNWIGLAIREVAAISIWLILTHPMAGPLIVEGFKPGWGKYAQIFVLIPFLACPFGFVASIGGDMWLETSPRVKKYIISLEGHDDNGRGQE